MLFAPSSSAPSVVGMLMAGPNRVRMVEALVFKRQSC